MSPLRYPGGKRRLAVYVAEALRINKVTPKLFVEPFAGGASVALQLLNNDLVEKIALGEKDPLVASFWKTVFYDHEWLIEKLRDTAPTLENWDRFKRGKFLSTRSQALACIFLNRTSFSGILAGNAGPLGGRAQVSEHTINCRYPVNVLVKRIEQAAKLADRVAFVKEADWRGTIKSVKLRRYRPNEVVYYFDPPFYYKANKLYRHFFAQSDHRLFHDALAALGQHWILSYDVAEPIVEMYAKNGIGPKKIELLYTAGSNKGTSSQELIVTNLPKLPGATRLWQTSAEWSELTTDVLPRLVRRGITG